MGHEFGAWEEEMFGRRNVDDEREAARAEPLKRRGDSRYGRDDRPQYVDPPMSRVDAVDYIVRLDNSAEGVPGVESTRRLIREIRREFGHIFAADIEDLDGDHRRLREDVEEREEQTQDA